MASSAPHSLLTIPPRHSADSSRRFSQMRQATSAIVHADPSSSDSPPTAQHSHSPQRQTATSPSQVHRPHSHSQVPVPSHPAPSPPYYPRYRTPPPCPLPP